MYKCINVRICATLFCAWVLSGSSLDASWIWESPAQAAVPWPCSHALPWEEGTEGLCTVLGERVLGCPGALIRVWCPAGLPFPAALPTGFCVCTTGPSWAGGKRGKWCCWAEPGSACFTSAEEYHALVWNGEWKYLQSKVPLTRNKTVWA